MSFSWGSYDFHEMPDGVIPFIWRDVAQEAARAFYDRLMSSKEHRITQLYGLSQRNEVDLDAEDWIEQASELFYENLYPAEDKPHLIHPDWHSYTTDLGLLLGERLIAERPQLSWRFNNDGPASDAYRLRPVIGGFTNVPALDYIVSFEYTLSECGNALIAGRGDDPDRSLIRRKFTRALSEA